MAARVLEGGLPGGAGRPRRPHLLPVLVRAVPRLLDGLRRRLRRSARTACPAAACRARIRLGLIETPRATVVCCTPTYALHLAEVAAEEGPKDRPLREQRACASSSWPASPAEASRPPASGSSGAWGARVIDHHGLTEVGPISFECWESPGFLHLNEERFLCEVLDPADPRAGARRRARRARGDEPGPHGQPRPPLPHGRHRGATLRALRLRPHLGAPRGRHPGPGRRHGERARGQRLSRRDRGRRAPLPEVVEFRSTVAAGGPLRVAVGRDRARPATPGPAGASRRRVAERLREALGLTVPVRRGRTGAAAAFRDEGTPFCRGGAKSMTSTGDGVRRSRRGGDRRRALRGPPPPP